MRASTAGDRTAGRRKPLPCGLDAPSPELGPCWRIRPLRCSRPRRAAGGAAERPAPRRQMPCPAGLLRSRTPRGKSAVCAGGQARGVLVITPWRWPASAAPGPCPCWPGSARPERRVWRQPGDIDLDALAVGDVHHVQGDDTGTPSSRTCVARYRLRSRLEASTMAQRPHRAAALLAVAEDDVDGHHLVGAAAARL